MHERVVTVHPVHNVNFKPQRWIGGDLDFKGHGPHVEVKVEVVPSERRLQAKLHMHAKETKADWTEVEGDTAPVIYEFPEGVQVLEVFNSKTNVEYTDTDHDADVFDYPGRAVERLWVYGDGPGDDVRRLTGVTVKFGPISCRVRLPDNVDVVEGLATPLFVPPHKGQGDKDFATHWNFFQIKDMRGTVKAKLSVRDAKTLVAKLYMEVEEDGGDHTRVEGWSDDYKLIDFDHPIVKILSDTSTEMPIGTFHHGWHQDRGLGMHDGQGELVHTFNWYGDGPGDEAGTKTAVNATLNPVFLQVGP